MEAWLASGWLDIIFRGMKTHAEEYKKVEKELLYNTGGGFWNNTWNLAEWTGGLFNRWRQ